MLAVLASPPVLADNSSAEVNLKVKVVSPYCVITLAARSVCDTEATLRGILIGRHSAPPVLVNFGWDTVSHADDPTAYGNWTEPQTMRRGRIFDHRLSGLSPGTTYYFRARAEGDGVSSYGKERSLTTPPKTHWSPRGWWHNFCQWFKRGW